MTSKGEPSVSDSDPVRVWHGIPLNVLLLLVLSVVALLLLAVAAVMAQETWTRLTWDTHLLLANAERLHRLGGTYYITTAEQKGPLWQFMFDLALMITSRRDVWYVIATMIVVLGALTGAAVTALLRAARLPAWAAVTVGVAATVYLWFGDQEWNRALYSRNIVAFLTVASLALVVAGVQASGRRRWLAILTAGALMGVAAQTNPGSTLTAVLVLAVLWVLGRTPGPNQASIRALGVLTIPFVTAFIVVLASAPLLYLSLGVFDDFWAQWWTYNMYYTEATGRSYPSIVAKGVTDFVLYYTSHPLLGITAATYCIAYVLAVPRLSGWDRRLGILLIVWWLAEMTAVGLSQRFFPHYLVLPFLPVALMAGSLFGKFAAWLQTRPSFSAVAAEGKYAVASVVILVVVMLNMPRVSEAAERALAFRGFESAAAARDANLSPSDTALREAVDTWSAPDDFVFAWTNWPYVWDVIGRTAATRYVDKKWLVGEIFGGGIEPEWILPGTWENWADDMVQTSPELIITFPGEPVPTDTPAADLISCGYDKVYEDEDRTLYQANGELADCLQRVREDILAQGYPEGS